MKCILSFRRPFVAFCSGIFLAAIVLLELAGGICSCRVNWLHSSAAACRQKWCFLFFLVGQYEIASGKGPLKKWLKNWCKIKKREKIGKITLKFITYCLCVTKILITKHGGCNIFSPQTGREKLTYLCLLFRNIVIAVVLAAKGPLAKLAV